MKVKDCMCDDVCCAKPETTVSDVAKMMSQNHIGSVPICDDNNCLCGIVTDRDILLRTVACNKNAETTPISEIMTCDVCSCKEDDEVTNAESKMCQEQIRRLPVCDSNNHVIGILTIGDLCNNDQKLGPNQVNQTIKNICESKYDEKNSE